jgi:hypothetical protein
VRRLFHHTLTHQARQSDAHGTDLMWLRALSTGGCQHLMTQLIGQAIGWHLHQRIVGRAVGRKAPQGTLRRTIFEEAGEDVLR